MKRVALTAALAVIVTLPMVSGDVAFAQNAPDQQQTLRRDIERRFEVIPLRSSVVLTPKGGNRRVGSIELTENAINVDGAPATGGELREKLGADADLVLKLSYLEPSARQTLFAAVGRHAGRGTEPAGRARSTDSALTGPAGSLRSPAAAASPSSPARPAPGERPRPVRRQRDSGRGRDDLR